MDALLITPDLHVYGGLCYHIYWFSGALDTEHGFQISHQQGKPSKAIVKN